MNASYAMQRRLLVSSALMICVSSAVFAKGPVNRYQPGRSSNRSVSFWSIPSYFRSPSSEVPPNRVSHASSGLRTGDKAKVTVEDAKIMSGTKILAVSEKGQEFIVHRVKGPWVAAQVVIDEKLINGWIWVNHLAKVESATKPNAVATSVANREPTRCSPYGTKRPYRTNRRYRR